MKLNYNKFLYYIFILYFIGILFMINIIFNDIDYKYESIFIISSYFIVLLIYSIAIIKDGFDIFQPLHFITILYICIFIFCPLYLIYQGRTTVNGSYIMDGCIKATIVYILSYLSFVCGYLIKKAPKFL